ncbi:MAG: hypothetical protein ABH863_06035 [Candidatus Micrarchaeota archaeon]
MDGAFDAYISNSALAKAEKAVVRAANEGKEAMGLLVGDVLKWKGFEYVLVENFITAKNDSSAVSVRFSRDAFTELSRAYSGHFRDGKMIVGWLHSHPSYGCWLSATDVGTQNRFFTEPHSIAMVLDPMREEGRRMQGRVFRVAGNAYYEISFAVIDKK